MHHLLFNWLFLLLGRKDWVRSRKRLVRDCIVDYNMCNPVRGIFQEEPKNQSENKEIIQNNTDRTPNLDHNRIYWPSCSSVCCVLSFSTLTLLYRYRPETFFDIVNLTDLSASRTWLQSVNLSAWERAYPTCEHVSVQTTLRFSRTYWHEEDLDLKRSSCWPRYLSRCPGSLI